MRLATLGLVLLAACSGTANAPKLAAAPTSALRQGQTDQLHETVDRLTSRSGANTNMTQGANGLRVFQVQEGMSEVVVARTNSDGSVTTKCVSSPSDAVVDSEALRTGNQK
jgi:hypothetical protein